MMISIATLLRDKREQLEMTQEEFWGALCEGLPGVSVSKQAASMWERGVQVPPYYLMLAVMLAHGGCRGDWRYELALGCVKILRPGLFYEGMAEGGAS